jgi:hypothetical protein
MDSYINPNNPYDFGGAIQRGLEGGTRKRVTREAKSYFDEGDYDRAAETILPYDADQAQNYLTYGKRQADQDYSSGLTPYLAKNDYEGAKQYAVTKNRGADDLMKLQDWAVSAQDQEKKAMAEKINQGASALYAASQLAESGDMDSWNTALDELEGQGYDVKNFKGRPYNRAQLQAELVKSEKGLKILEVLDDRRKTDISERRATAAEATAAAALARANGGGGDSEWTPQRAFSNERTLRSEYIQQVKPLKEAHRDAQTISPYASAVVKSQGRPTGDKETIRNNDAILLMTVARMAQGPGVLSDQDITLATGAGLDSIFANAPGWVMGGGRLSERQRYALGSILSGRQSYIKTAADQVTQEYRDLATTYRLNPNNVIGAGNVGPDAPLAQESNYPKPKPEAVALLRNRPALAAEFDSKYGPGASQQYLGRR